MNNQFSFVPIDPRTPVDYIEPQVDVWSAQERYIGVLQSFANRIKEGLSSGDMRSAQTSFWGAAYGLGLKCCANITMTQRASMIGVKRATISKAAQSFITDNSLPPSFHMKSSASHVPYAIARKSYIANGSHKKFKV